MDKQIDSNEDVRKQMLQVLRESYKQQLDIFSTVSLRMGENNALIKESKDKLEENGKIIHRYNNLRQAEIELKQAELDNGKEQNKAMLKIEEENRKWKYKVKEKLLTPEWLYRVLNLILWAILIYLLRNYTEALKYVPSIPVGAP